MPDFPVMMRVRGRRCVIVGGGSVALRRAKSLLHAGAEVFIVAPDVDPELRDLGITIEDRPYRQGDLAGALLVIIATDDPNVNQQVADDAIVAGVLVNRADAPESGDFVVPAYASHSPVTLAVYTSGISSAASAAIRRQLSEALDPAWPLLLQTIAPFRLLIQERIADPRKRRSRLARLIDADAFEALRVGGPEALRQYCEQIAGKVGGEK